ncbi:MAG: hypothetical protein KAJ01_04365, partial [Candidatus Hydrogenedentes bacterium]|nr:hypothetical protein [Candidatus Hydrogenedentota bacterium]
RDRSTRETWAQIREVAMALFKGDPPDLPDSVQALPSKVFPVEFEVWGRAAKIYLSEQRRLIVEVAPAHRSRISAYQLVEALISAYGGVADNRSESPTKDNPMRLRHVFSKSFEGNPLYAIGFFSGESSPLLVYRSDDDEWVLEFQIVPPYRTAQFRNSDRGAMLKAFLAEILGVTLQEECGTWGSEELTDDKSPVHFSLFSRKAEAFADDGGHWIVRFPCTQGFQTLEELVDSVGGTIY